jgi:hypothetical protein
MTTAAALTAAALDEGVSIGIPVGRRRLDHLADLGPLCPRQRIRVRASGLGPFKDRHLTRDPIGLRERVEAAWPRLPDGRLLVLRIAGVSGVCRLA